MNTPLHRFSPLPLKPTGAEGSFHRCNLNEVHFEDGIAHEGVGKIRFHRILTAPDIAGACNFMDVSIVPPGCSVGEHAHARDEEEFYLILEGAALMQVNGQRFRVQAGDLVRNPPGGIHSLHNDGRGDLKMFVFELRVGV
jgi:mannose-6-phosphate isomerase-like protein (cupin superfamily)